MNIKPIGTIEGIVVGNTLVLDLLMTSVNLASSAKAMLPSSISRELQRVTTQSALHTVNSLLVAASAKCNLDPPPADIDMVVDSSGRLILRCQHKKAHRWTLDGNKI